MAAMTSDSKILLDEFRNFRQEVQLGFKTLDEKVDALRENHMRLTETQGRHDERLKQLETSRDKFGERIEVVESCVQASGAIGKEKEKASSRIALWIGMGAGWLLALASFFIRKP